MIIYINGVSGSGKSTLGSWLSKVKGVYKVIDTDDIDDEIMLKLIKLKPKLFLTPEGMKTISKIENDLNFKAYMKLRDYYCFNNPDKVLILVGLLFCAKKNNKDFLKHVRKYYIDIDPETNYNRLFIRTARDMCANLKGIERRLNSGEHPKIINALILHKYKNRISIPINYDKLVERLTARKKLMIADKYKIMSQLDILNDIKKGL